MICGAQGWTVKAKDYGCLENLPTAVYRKVIKAVLHGCPSIVEIS
jgi:hypothetical protein